MDYRLEPLELSLLLTPYNPGSMPSDSDGHARTTDHDHHEDSEVLRAGTNEDRGGYSADDSDTANRPRRPSRRTLDLGEQNGENGDYVQQFSIDEYSDHPRIDSHPTSRAGSPTAHTSQASFDSAVRGPALEGSGLGHGSAAQYADNIAYRPSSTRTSNVPHSENSSPRVSRRTYADNDMTAPVTLPPTPLDPSPEIGAGPTSVRWNNGRIARKMTQQTVYTGYSSGSDASDRRGPSRRPQPDERKRRAPESPLDPVAEAALPSEDVMAKIWPRYLDHAAVEDRETVQAWNTDLDGILIFAALFSAVLTTFIIESYQGLLPDPTSTTLQAILYELQIARNASAVSPSPLLQSFQPLPSAIRVNIYWFSSLILSLAAALITILAKQWVNYLLAGLSRSVPANRARLRQYRTDGVYRWHLPAVLSVLPILLHIALLLFFAGLVDFVWDINKSVAAVAAFLVCTTSIIYVVANLLAYVFPDCPFKTSVTVLFALLVDLSIVAWRRSRIAGSEVARALIEICGRAVWTCQRLCYHRRRSHSVDDIDLPIHPISTTPASETRKHEALRIYSLWNHDERFIEENASALDARILLWLVRNTTNQPRKLREELNHAIRHFPHLALHRPLFVKLGAIPLLEHLLRPLMSTAFKKLSKKWTEAASWSVHSLAVLQSERTLDGPESSVSVEDTSSLRDRPPFFTVEPTTNPPISLLSPSTNPLIVSLLARYQHLHLSLLASVIRLSVCIPEVSIGRAEWMRPGYRAVHHMIHLIKLNGPEKRSKTVAGGHWDHEDVTHGVNTLIYLALLDTWYPRRRGFIIPFIYDSRAWLECIQELLTGRSHLSRTARRQLSWAICALASSFHPHTIHSLGEAIVEPRILKLGTVRPFAMRLTALLSWDSDPIVFRVTVAALEDMMKNVKLGSGQDDSKILSHALSSSPILETFVAQLESRLTDGLGNSSHLLTLADIPFPPVLRIAVYIAISHTVAVDQPNAALIHSILVILWHLLTPRRYVDKGDFPSSKPGFTPGPEFMADASGWPLKRWIWSISGHIITLLLRQSDSPLAHPLTDLQELRDLDTSAFGVAGTLARALCSIAEWPPKSPSDHTQLPRSMAVLRAPLEAITTVVGIHSANLEWRIGTPILEPFAGILQEMFEQWAKDMTFSPTPIVYKGGSRQVAIRFIRQGGLDFLLDASCAAPNNALYLGALLPALRSICAVLDGGAGQEPTLEHRNRPRHPAYVLASALDDSQLSAHLRGVRGEKPWRAALDRAANIYVGADSESRMKLSADLLVCLIRTSGMLALYTPHAERGTGSDAEYPHLPVVRNTAWFFSKLLTRKQQYAGMSLMVRRHLWGTLGSFATINALPSQELCEDRDPGRFFRFDTFDADRLATGLVDALMLRPGIHFDSDVARGLPFDERNRLLANSSSGRQGHRAHGAFEKLSEAALRAISMLWGSDDAESIAVRDSLLGKDLAIILKLFLSSESSEEMKAWVNDIMSRIPSPPEENREPPPDEEAASPR